MKNWKAKAVSAVLALSILVPTAAFAADAVTDNTKAMPGWKGFGHHQAFNQEKQQEFQTQLLELVTKYTPDSLTEWKSALAEQATLMQQIKDKQPAVKERTQLSAETKANLDAIREAVKAGNITQTEAREQMKALGIEHRFKDGKDLKDRPELSAEVKEKLAAIQAVVQKRNLTKEQAKAEMAKLGLKVRGDGEKTNPMAQFRAAVEAEDATKIQELLPQMLSDLQERNQAMSNKLAESQN